MKATENNEAIEQAKFFLSLYKAKKLKMAINNG